MHKLTVISAVGLCNIVKVHWYLTRLRIERIYGIQQRNNQYQEDSNNVGKLTQEDLLKQLGLNKETYRQAKSLTTLPSEIQDLIEQGRFPKWESACYFRSWNPILEFHAAVSSKNNCSKTLKNAIIKGFFDILKFRRMSSERHRKTTHSKRGNGLI